MATGGIVRRSSAGRNDGVGHEVQHGQPPWANRLSLRCDQHSCNRRVTVGHPVRLGRDVFQQMSGSMATLTLVTDEPPEPTHVLTIPAVRWAIERLGGQKIHPTFIFYLYLRKQQVEGTLADASSSSREVFDLLRMPGGPPGKPYYRPFRERGTRQGELLRSFWLGDNVAGSWSPRSLNRQVASRWLVDSSGAYVVPRDHTARAKTEMLYGETVPAVAIGAYFLRNEGFIIDGEPSPNDIVSAFRVKFRYDESHDNEFTELFDGMTSSTEFRWFESALPQSFGDVTDAAG